MKVPARVAGSPSRLALACALAAALACDQYRTAGLMRSFPVALPRSVSPRTIEGAIELCLAKRHWFIVERDAHRYRARLAERVHKVDIEIDYDARGFAINYVDSENLHYEKHADGSETIHRKYMTWVVNLADDIRVHVASASLPASDMRGVPPPGSTWGVPPPPTRPSSATDAGAP